MAHSVTGLQDLSVLAGAGEWTISFTARVATEVGDWLRLTDADPTPLLWVGTRRCGDDPNLFRFDHTLQNYTRHPLPDGRVLALECVVRTKPPAELIARRGAAAPAEMRQGLMRLGLPLSLIADRFEVEIIIRVSAARCALFVDGVLVDEDFPVGARSIQGTPARTASGDLFDNVQVWPRALDDAEVSALAGGAERVALRARHILGEENPIGQYWQPRGFNQIFGDTMMASDGARLHLFYLSAPRMGSLKYGTGGAEFRHASSADLRVWEKHPTALPITEPWQAALGTGTAVFDGTRYHLFTNIVTNRLGLEHLYPNRIYHATSADGIHYSAPACLTVGGEPGILRDEAGTWHAVSSSQHADGVWRCVRMESDNLHDWRIVDREFLLGLGWPYSHRIFSSECFCWFKLGEWFYILGGRTGFWRSRQLKGPYYSATHGTPVPALSPAWDVYDGLIVPQAAVHRGRAILSAWLAYDHEWAGHLVWREVHQLPDGNLVLRRLPELEPAVGRELLHCPQVVADGTKALAFAPWLLPAGHVRVRMVLEPEGAGRFGLCIGNGELRFEPARGTAQWGTAKNQTLADEPTTMPADGKDFVLSGFTGLDRAFTLDLIIYRDEKKQTTIVDAEVGELRTIISRRPGPAGPQAAFFAEGGRLRVRDLRVHAVSF